MSYADAMARAWPGKTNIDREALIACIDACNDCAQACTASPDADMSGRSFAHILPQRVIHWALVLRSSDELVE